jgi:hypothetical protein
MINPSFSPEKTSISQLSLPHGMKYRVFSMTLPYGQVLLAGPTGVRSRYLVAIRLNVFAKVSALDYSATRAWMKRVS